VLLCSEQECRTKFLHLLLFLLGLVIPKLGLYLKINTVSSLRNNLNFMKHRIAMIYLFHCELYNHYQQIINGRMNVPTCWNLFQNYASILSFSYCTRIDITSLYGFWYILYIYIYISVYQCVYIYLYMFLILRARGSVVVEALCYKPEDSGFETRWGEWLFQIYLILPAALGPGVYSASNRNEYQKRRNNISVE
jgi:hypothetical protein